MNDKPAILVLEDGTVFQGVSVGADTTSFGEVVFQTGLTGYQEVLTDPSYAGQIVAMTAVEIGNTGITSEDDEAARPYCAGFVMREASSVVSSWRAERSLQSFLIEHGIPGIAEIDTRALTRRLRDQGSMRGAIAVGNVDPQEVLAKVRSAPTMEGQDLATRVSTERVYEWTEPTWAPPQERSGRKIEPTRHHVVAVDYGVKRNILRNLRDVGCRVTVVPCKTTAHEILAHKPDGIVLSNGPGDPAAVKGAADIVQKLLGSGVPLLGICLGHQILGLALGARTFKLRFGHHGSNHPVMDLATGRVEITAQNHNFCVDLGSLPDSAGVEKTHVNLNDRTVEGMKIKGKPAFSVQYHPEASPGPHDANYVFRRFADTMR